MEYCLVYTTVPNLFNGNYIATTLIDEKLAACVNVVPNINSVYRWMDSVQTDTEQMLIIKTKISLYDKVEAKIKELHEYTLPEIIAIPVIKGSAEYLGWIDKETKDA